jgi:hypothetical protein
VDSEDVRLNFGNEPCESSEDEDRPDRLTSRTSQYREPTVHGSIPEIADLPINLACNVIYSKYMNMPTDF